MNETGPVHAAGAAVAPTVHVPSWRLLATLAFGGALAGALIATVYRETLPAIQKAADEKTQGAVSQVLAAPARLDTVYLTGDSLSRIPPAGQSVRAATKAFVGYDASGTRIGVAVEAAQPGFVEDIRLLVGFDPGTGAVTGFAVLGQKETPGLGDKIEKDTTFIAQFRGKMAPLVGAKQGSETGPGAVHTITGATISSRAVIKTINGAVAFWRPRLAALDAGGKP